MKMYHPLFATAEYRLHMLSEIKISEIVVTVCTPHWQTPCFYSCSAPIMTTFLYATICQEVFS